MKRRMVAAISTAILIGCSSMVVGDTAEASKVVNKVIEKETSTNSNLYKWNKVIYFVRNIEDTDKLTSILENRNGKIIIEVIQGVVLDSDGNGADSCGNYIHYDMDKFSAGNKVQSVLVYNPGSNAIDDILYRVDVLIK